MLNFPKLNITLILSFNVRAFEINLCDPKKDIDAGFHIVPYNPTSNIS